MAPGTTAPNLRPLDFRPPHDIRGRDDHQRPERVAMESTGSSVLITGCPQNSAAPDIIRDAKSPCFSG